uniref:ShKT domain-containing protein n=1 Tax=Parascaris univalens TaxID=6257 RepID=A0A915C633_PARUN
LRGLEVQREQQALLNRAGATTRAAAEATTRARDKAAASARNKASTRKTSGNRKCKDRLKNCSQFAHLCDVSQLRKHCPLTCNAC